MYIVLTILGLLLMAPFIIKLGVLYMAYIQWMLSLPFPFRVSLFNRSADDSRPKKPPIGFSTATQEPEPSPVGKKK